MSNLVSTNNLATAGNIVCTGNITSAGTLTCGSLFTASNFNITGNLTVSGSTTSATTNTTTLTVSGSSTLANTTISNLTVSSQLTLNCPVLPYFALITTASQVYTSFSTLPNTIWCNYNDTITFNSTYITLPYTTAGNLSAYNGMTISLRCIDSCPQFFLQCDANNGNYQRFVYKANANTNRSYLFMITKSAQIVHYNGVWYEI